MSKADMTPEDDRPADDRPAVGDHEAIDQEPDAGLIVDPVETLTVDEVATLLKGAGRGLHSAFGDPRIDEHWAFTNTEIESLAPPLTAIVNRRPALLAVVRRSDAATATLLMAAYLRRNLKLSAEIAAADEAAADADRVPIVPDDGDRPRDIGAGDD